MACHWVHDKEVPGGKFWRPECWGGLYDPDGCYCPRPPRATKDELAERVKRLEKRIADLESRKGAQ
jgi:hypothetical protein